MGSSLDSKKVDELLDKYRALAEKEQRRVNELEARDAHFVSEVRTSLTVTSSAFGMGFLRGYLGEKANIWGISIDAGVACLFHGLAACLGFSLNKTAQKVGKFFHDLANGALASRMAVIGADLGEQKRKAKPAPAPQPNTGAVASAQRAPERGSGPMTTEELAAMAMAAALKTPPTVPGRSPDPAQPSATPTTEPSASATSSSRPKPYRFTQRDSNAVVRDDLQSIATPPLPDVSESMQKLSEQYSLEKLAPILRWAGIPT